VPVSASPIFTNHRAINHFTGFSGVPFSQKREKMIALHCAEYPLLIRGHHVNICVHLGGYVTNTSNMRHLENVDVSIQKSQELDVPI
jgi:hypothetical protein